MPDSYRVQLDVFNGPLDLLLYLIKQEEVDITAVSVVRILDSFLKDLEGREVLDMERAGDFVVSAAALTLLKSRLILPCDEDDLDEEEIDPRQDLVQQLIEYKRFKDLSVALGERKVLREKKYSRGMADPSDAEEVVEQGNPLEDISLWDLVEAFSKVVSEVGVSHATEIVMDETPIEEHMNCILEHLGDSSESTLAELLGENRNEGYLVGIFVALLELCRQRRIRIRQEREFGEVFVSIGALIPLKTEA